MKSPPRTAVGLDIGSNTISCTQLHLNKNGVISVQRDKSFPVRLSEGLKANGELKPAAIQRGLEAIAQIVEKFDYQSSRTRAVGTAVLRMTSNPSAFTEAASKLLGTPIDIIDGDEEARLTARGAVFGLEKRNDWVILDIGGQSTELSHWDSMGNWQSVSMPLGVVQVTEQFFTAETPSEHEQECARELVRKRMEEYVSGTIHGALVCVGGTPTTLSKLVHRMEKWDRNKVHGSLISVGDAQKWLAISAKADVQTRIAQYGMKPMRADVFPAGILILDEIMQFLKMETFTVSANGLRVGLALSLFE